ncbi:MAG: hypothetical protein V4481_00615 [Patescibacteria group bacterium]
MATLKKPKDQDVMGPIHASIKRIDFYMVGVVLVAIFGFLTLLVTVSGLVIDSYRFKASSYETLVDKVSLLLQKADSEKNSSGQLDMLKAEIDSLRKNNSYLK